MAMDVLKKALVLIEELEAENQPTETLRLLRQDNERQVAEEERLWLIEQKQSEDSNDGDDNGEEEEELGSDEKGDQEAET